MYTFFAGCIIQDQGVDKVYSKPPLRACSSCTVGRRLCSAVTGGMQEAGRSFDGREAGTSRQTHFTFSS